MTNPPGYLRRNKWTALSGPLSEAVVQQEVQEGARHEVVEWPGEAHVQAVSRPVVSASGVGVCSECEGGDV